MNTDRFKFRAWNKLTRKYIPNIQDRDLVEGGLIDDDTFFDDYLYDSDYVIEQCTGLTDKTDRLIYEGDIIADEDLADVYEQRMGVAEVRWNNESAEFGLYLADGDYATFDNTGSSVEVIGNIHENPELLEEEK